MKRNLASSLRRRSRPRPMEHYDRLPPELRAWLAKAALPWSPQSALRLWQRVAPREGAGEALRRLDLAEARLLARDCSRIWGPSYPLGVATSGPLLSLCNN